MIKSGKGIQEVRSTKTNSETICVIHDFQFLDDLEQKLRPVGLKERETLIAMKRKEHEEKGIPFDGELYIWDFGYYARKYVEETLSLDDMLVKEYFPVSAVVPTILSIYQNLLGVRFEALKEASTWHPG